MRTLPRNIRIACVLGVLGSVGCVGPASPLGPSGPQSPLEKRFTDDPNDAKTNLMLGETAELQGDLLRAEQYYVRAEALRVPEDEILPRILRVLVRAKRYEEAIVRCKERLARQPSDRTTRFLFAALLQGRERNDLAESELLVLLKHDDKDGQAHLAIGRLYRDAFRDPQRALPHLKKYLELDPNGSDAAQVRFELAELSMPEPSPTTEPKP